MGDRRVGLECRVLSGICEHGREKGILDYGSSLHVSMAGKSSVQKTCSGSLLYVSMWSRRHTAGCGGLVLYVSMQNAEDVFTGGGQPGLLDIRQKGGYKSTDHSNCLNTTSKRNKYLRREKLTVITILFA
jgi:hypothetical protein